MFSKKIINTDAFLDMPMSSQLLYFHLAMNADDEGFVGSPKRLMRLIGSCDDDFKVLVTKRFILTFESGVVVIKHWLIHNTIRKDRQIETTYQKEKDTLKHNEYGAYTEMTTIGKPNGNQMSVKPSPRLDKIRLDKTSTPDNEFNLFWDLYDKKRSKPKTLKLWNNLSLEERKLIMLYIPHYKKSQPNKKYRKDPDVFLRNNCWEDELVGDIIEEDNLINKRKL